MKFYGFIKSERFRDTSVSNWHLSCVPQDEKELTKHMEGRWISGRMCKRPCGERDHGSLKEMSTGQSEGTVV